MKRWAKHFVYFLKSAEETNPEPQDRCERGREKWSISSIFSEDIKFTVMTVSGINAHC